MISKSYPFMHISKLYGIPYENVLKVADDLKNTGKADFRLLGNIEAALHTAEAIDYFKRVQAGIEPFH